MYIYHNIISIILGYNRDKSKIWAILQSLVSVSSINIMPSAVYLTVLSFFGTASYSSVNYTYLWALCVFCVHASVCFCVYVHATTHMYVCVHMLCNMCGIRGWFMIAQFFNFLLLPHKLWRSNSRSGLTDNAFILWTSHQPFLRCNSS